MRRDQERIHAMIVTGAEVVADENHHRRDLVICNLPRGPTSGPARSTITGPNHSVLRSYPVDADGYGLAEDDHEFNG